MPVEITRLLEAAQLQLDAANQAADTATIRLEAVRQSYEAIITRQQKWQAVVDALTALNTP